LSEADTGDGVLVVGTTPFIGEGFDAPALDTLFLAASLKRRMPGYRTLGFSESSGNQRRSSSRPTPCARRKLRLTGPDINHLGTLALPVVRSEK